MISAQKNEKKLYKMNKNGKNSNISKKKRNIKLEYYEQKVIIKSTINGILMPKNKRGKPK